MIMRGVRPRIKIIIITHNRPHYTRLSLARLCDNAPSNAKITIWDNASSKETVDVIKVFEGHPAVDEVRFNKTNDRIWAPTNWFWENSEAADLIGKVDDDCLVPENWCEVLEKAHTDVAEAGVLECWRFLPEDFDPAAASKKIFKYGTHSIFRNCWVEGSGYLMKRSVIEKIGYLRPRETFTTYCVRAAAAGFVNGWYYPFLFQEHMDDPRAEHTGIKTDADFKRLMPLSATAFKVQSREEWLEIIRDAARRIHEYSLDPYDFIGFKVRLKKSLFHYLGKDYFPKMK